MPLVFQYNKQDLPNAVSPVELEEKLNFRKVPSYATIATKGDGVFEAFIAVSKLMVSRVIKTYNLKEEQADEGRILAEVESRLRSLGSRTAAGVTAASASQPTAVTTAPSPAAAAAQAISAMANAGTAPAAETTSEDRTTQEAADFIESLQGNAAAPPPKPPEPPSVAQEQQPSSTGSTHTQLRPVHRAQRAPQTSPLPDRPDPPAQPPETTQHEEAASLRRESRPAEASSPERLGRDAWSTTGSTGGPSIRNLLRTLLEIGRRMAAGSPLENLATIVLSQACEVMEAMGGSLLVSDETGEKLEPLAVNGFRVDPILNSGSDDGRQLIGLLDRCGDQLFISRDHHPELYGPLEASSPGIEAALVLPLVVGNRVQGGLVVYLDEPLDLAHLKEPLKILVVLAYQLAVGLVLNRRQPEPATPHPGP